MSQEWLEWHKRYDQDAHQAQRLALVQDRLRDALDHALPGTVRLISLCAGDGRDVLGVLPTHRRGPDVRARLIDLEPTLVEEGRREIARLKLGHVEFVLGDASTTTACEGLVPADIILACGIFGNISDSDVRHTVESFPALCANGATVIWTRGRFEPDLTPTIREWFRGSGFQEVAFVTVPGSTASVDEHRLVGPPQPFRRGVRLFTFLPSAERPSTKGRSATEGSTRPPGAC